MIEEMEEEILEAVEAEEWIDVIMIEMVVATEIEWVLITLKEETGLEEIEEVMIEMIDMQIEVTEIVVVIIMIEEMLQTDLMTEEEEGKSYIIHSFIN